MEPQATTQAKEGDHETCLDAIPAPGVDISEPINLDAIGFVAIDIRENTFVRERLRPFVDVEGISELESENSVSREFRSEARNQRTRADDAHRCNVLRMLSSALESHVGAHISTAANSKQSVYNGAK